MTTPPRRRWLQFSLRTMFFATTAVAVILGAAIAAVRLADALVAKEHQEFESRQKGRESLP